MSSIHCTAEETRKLHQLLKLNGSSQLATISCFLCNARSLNNKIDLIVELLNDNQVDFAFITETWFSQESNAITSIIKQAGYEIEHVYRSKKGAGVAILWKSNFKVKCNFKRKSYETFQFTNVEICGTVKINVICIYRLQETSPAEFMLELDHLLSQYISKSDTIVLTGDFNFHFEKSELKDVIALTDVTSSYGLSQFVAGPSHILGHTLDLVFANKHELDLPILCPVDMQVCDHFPILFNLPRYMQPCTPNTSKVQCRNIKSIDRPEFSSNLCDMLNSKLNVCNAENLEFEDHYKIFSDCATELLNNVAPQKVRTLPGDSQPAWFDAEYREARALRRRLERTWKASKLQEDKDNYLRQCKYCAQLVTRKRSDYLAGIIAKCEGDQRALLKIVNTVLDKRKNTAKLPEFNSPKTLANQFNEFYSNKVAQIRNKIKPSTSEQDFRKKFDGVVMDSFEPATVAELREIIKKTGIKTSSQDPLPGSLCKDIIEDLLPYYCKLVNTSLRTGSVEGIKDSIIIPLLKKSGLDSENLKNYRPVTNEVYISKLIEKVVEKRIFHHMNVNNLHSMYQHGYKMFHGTETLLLKIVDDLLIGFDSNHATILLLIDLSAAFDTVDILLLLDILDKDIGIKGTALLWFKSFLSGRTQCVKIKDTLSDILPVLFGVPQGSVLGPILFNIYTSSLSFAIKNFGFCTSGYADDNNAYQSFPLAFQFNIISEQLPELLNIIHEWMNMYFLKMNPDKTEIIMLLPQQLKDVHTINGCIFSDGTCKRFSNFVRNLGFILDRHLTMDAHVNNVVSVCFKYLSDIGKIRNLLNEKDTKLLVHSVVSSRLDYCNSLLYGVNTSVINKLQKVQNAAARLISRRKKHDHISDIIHKLHWLRVECRVIFKLLVLIYKCLHEMAPECLVQLIDVKDNSRCILFLKHYQSNYARRSFRYIAPKLWNNLPEKIRLSHSLSNFKSQTKHLLFNDFEKYKRSVFKYN